MQEIGKNGASIDENLTTTRGRSVACILAHYDNAGKRYCVISTADHNKRECLTNTDEG